MVMNICTQSVILSTVKYFKFAGLSNSRITRLEEICEFDVQTCVCSLGNSRLYRLDVSLAQKPRSREINTRSYSLHSVRPQVFFSPSVSAIL